MGDRLKRDNVEAGDRCGTDGLGARVEAVGMGEMDQIGCEGKLRGPRAEP